MERAPSNHRS